MLAVVAVLAMAEAGGGAAKAPGARRAGALSHRRRHEGRHREGQQPSKCSAFVLKTADKVFLTHNNWNSFLDQSRALSEWVAGDFITASLGAPGYLCSDLDQRMATQPSVVARLEAGGGRQKHSPSLATLLKSAAAVGCRLEIKMVRVRA